MNLRASGISATALSLAEDWIALESDRLVAKRGYGLGDDERDLVRRAWLGACTAARGEGASIGGVAGQGPETEARTYKRLVSELAGWVARLASALHAASPTDDLPVVAGEFLLQRGLAQQGGRTARKRRPGS